MARMLGRSRSLRMLRGGHKETYQQDTGDVTPPPAQFPIDLDRLKAATPVTRADGRAETPDIIQRPKTSGGPGDRGKQFHKKVSPVAKDPKSTFPFPSPNNKSTTTILYTAEVHEDREGIIGIALGSPTMNPNWNITPRTTDFVTNNSGTITHISSNSTWEEAHDAKQEATKPKVSRWKSIFGRKPQPAQEQKPSFYQLAQSVMPARADSHHDEESLYSQTLSQADDYLDGPRSVSPPTFNPEIRESRKVPKGQEQPANETRPRALTFGTSSSGRPKTTLMRSASSPKTPGKTNWNDSPSIPQIVYPSSSSTQPNGEKPLLDVDIPSIKMERYSVMFSNFLQPNSNRSSSLLVRRQGNSERLKPLNELSTKAEGDPHRNGIVKPQRRATSPSYPKSPSVALSLFPQPANRAPSPRTVSVHRPRPLQRSRTAPTSSPNRQNFLIVSPDEGGKEAFQKPRSQKQISEQEDPNEMSQLLTPTPTSRHSFDSDSEEVPIVVDRAPTASWKRPMDEPEWEIVSRPSRNTAFTSHPVGVGAPLEQGPSSAPLESRADDRVKIKVEPTPRSADRASPRSQRQDESQATVGVARSVSVSRTSPRSAELLKPTLVRNATERSISPGPNGRFVDQKPLTPTLVELKNRKSQRVQLVDA